jgi:hypothetical protein
MEALCDEDSTTTNVTPGEFGGGLKILFEVLGGLVHRDAPTPELPLELWNR